MNIIKKIGIILSVFFLNGCSNSFLEPDSLSTFDTKYLFSNVDDARKATNACYVNFSDDGYVSRLCNVMQTSTDVEMYGTTAGYDIQSVQAKTNIEINELKPQEGNGDLDKAWTSGYAAIRNCNIVIDGIHESGALNGTDPKIVADMNQFLGEAYTIRAYWYSMLIYSFGDIPFSTQAPKAGIDFNLPREDRNVILTQLIDDLKGIEDKMKWADELPYGGEQVNREFALGMIGKLALQRGGYYLKPDMTYVRPADYLDYYAIAKEYTGKLMTLKDRALPKDFAQVFKNECQYVVTKNDDVLFEIPFAIGRGDIGYSTGIAVSAGPSGNGNPSIFLTPNYYYSFDSKDIRRDISVGTFSFDGNLLPSIISITGLSQGKWSKAYMTTALGTTVTKGTGINWPLMRYPDVLLMYAEAENELNGPTESAKSALTRVRQRAFNSVDWPTKVDQYIATASASKDAFFNAIVDERAWEFGGEYRRRTDLIRWGNFKSKIQQTVTTLKALADESADINGIRPNYIYWKRGVNNKFVFYSADTREIPADYIVGNTNASIGWVRSSWLGSLKASTGIDGYSNFITTYWYYYLNTPQPVRYIMPIPSRAIIASQGVLKNDGYGYGN